MHRWFSRAIPIALLVSAIVPAAARAQAMERVTFEEAVRRAVANHPNVQRAASDILRAQAVAQQVRTRSLPSADVTFTTAVIDPITQFSGSAITPRTQTLTSGGVSVPLITPVSWAERNQAADDIIVSERAAGDVRRQVAVATAEAYLSIIAARRVLELNERARDNTRDHYEYAFERFQGGIGSRLNAVRAEEEVSANETRVEAARLAIVRAQESLGVLMAADGPIDAAADPVFELPPPSSDADLIASREDVQAIVARESAARRRASDVWKEYLPSVTALFTPQLLAPAGLFANARSWRASVLFSVPVFDAGQRRGEARERQALVDFVRAERADAERRAGSEIRTAREAIASSERALVYARRAVEQANEVVRISDIAFREGATTNIEVIDAQRRARDAETAAAIAEDAVRRARLELLVASSQFPE